MKNYGKVYFVENSIYSLIIVIELKRKRNFSIWNFMKNDGKVNFVEKVIYSLIILKKLKENKIFNFENFKNFIQWKMMEKLFLLKTLSIH